MNKYYVNDVGTAITIEAGTDISTATYLALKVKKPDGTLHEWVASLEGLTKLKYTVQAGDWDQKGRYYLQAYIEMPSWEGRGETVTFDIYDAYK